MSPLDFLRLFRNILSPKVTPTTTATSLAKLGKIGMVKETTGGRYGRLYAYDGYLKILVCLTTTDADRR